ncbi:MAG: vWA domain-containing protein [Acidimicrobiales bacterium]
MPKEDDPFIGVLVGFTHELRRAGVSVGSGDVLTYCAAMAPLDPTDLVDLYWAGRSTLITKYDNLTTYDEVFQRFFLTGKQPVPEMLMLKAHEAIETEGVLNVPNTDPGKEGDPEEAVLGLMASNTESLKHKAFAACTSDELAALRRIMARIRVTPPKRRTRRTVCAGAGNSLDMRRMVRESMRMHGEPSELYFRKRRLRIRPLILVLDISGSMADYSRNLLQFAYGAQRAASKVEVFCFGTRLTRITKELDHRKPDQALEFAAKTVFDWEGGTRIGASLDSLVRNWGRRGLCRGGIVVICSDGLDRGDPGILAEAMEHLSRLSYRVVWMNPHKGDNTEFKASTLGMMVAEPYVDLMLSGHDMASLEELASLLPSLN